TSAGQLKNFRYESKDITSKRDGLNALRQVEALQSIATDFGPLASYLAIAETSLPSDHPWIKIVQTVRQSLLTDLLDADKRESASFRQEAMQKLADLKKE